MQLFNNTTIANATEQPTAWIEQYKEPKGLYIFRLSLFSVIILASLVGNSMVCYAVWNIPSRKPLSYYLVANMAFAEILSSVCLAVMLASIEKPTDAALQKASCVFNPLQVIALLVVTYSLAAIAFYRYRFIVNPIPRGPSAERIKNLTIFGLWLLSLAIAFPLFFGLRFKDAECSETPVTDNKYYVIIRFILNYALPYVIMLASYGGVAWNLRKRIVEKEERARTSTIGSSCVAEIEDPVELEDVGNDKKEADSRCGENKRRKVLVDQNNRRDSKPETTDPEKDLLKMIFVLIIIFVVCYFPYQAMFVWERVYEISSYQFRYHQLMSDYVFILISLPSALHPLCYGTMNSFFAKAFSKIILCKSVKS